MDLLLLLAQTVQNLSLYSPFSFCVEPFCSVVVPFAVSILSNYPGQEVTRLLHETRCCIIQLKAVSQVFNKRNMYLYAIIQYQPLAGAGCAAPGLFNFAQA